MLVLALCLVSLVVMALDLRLDGRKFHSWPPRLVQGWVTVIRQANHLGISPSHLGQLSFLPYAGQEISTGQGAMVLCGWGVKADMVHATCG